MTVSQHRKEPENTGNQRRSAPGIDRNTPFKGVPVLSGQRVQGTGSGIGSLTFVQGEALRRFSKDTERSEASRDADKRLEARQSLSAAVAAMAPRERAVVDLLLIKGRHIRDLATAASTTVEDLDRLLHQAADTLAAHYQNREAA